MKYIGRYKKSVNYQDIVNDYPGLSSAQHLKHVYMFVFDSDSNSFVTLLTNDSRILHIEEDAITSHITAEDEYTDGMLVEHVQQSPSPPQEFARSITDRGNTVDNTLIDGFGSNYYWQLEHLMKHNFGFGPKATYHNYSY